jgi:hypothetical protein
MFRSSTAIFRLEKANFPSATAISGCRTGKIAIHNRKIAICYRNVAVGDGNVSVGHRTVEVGDRITQIGIAKTGCTMGITPKNGDSVVLDSLEVQAIYTLAGMLCCSSFWQGGQMTEQP